MMALMTFEETKETLRDYVRAGILDGWYWHDATGQLIWVLNFKARDRCESLTQRGVERWFDFMSRFPEAI